MGDHIVILSRWIIFSATGERAPQASDDIGGLYEPEENILDDRFDK